MKNLKELTSDSNNELLDKLTDIGIDTNNKTVSHVFELMKIGNEKEIMGKHILEGISRNASDQLDSVKLRKDVADKYINVIDGNVKLALAINIARTFLQNTTKNVKRFEVTNQELNNDSYLKKTNNEIISKMNNFLDKCYKHIASSKTPNSVAIIYLMDENFSRYGINMINESITEIENDNSIDETEKLNLIDGIEKLVLSLTVPYDKQTIDKQRDLTKVEIDAQKFDKDFHMPNPTPSSIR